MKVRHSLALTILAISIVLLAVTAAAAPYIVSNTNDEGAGSLRQAILEANANPGADSINFAIPGGGVQTIAPLTTLPAVTEQVTIDGYTQPGSSPNTLTNADDAVILVRLDGASLTNDLSLGLHLSSANGSVVRGLVLVRFDQGILVDNASNVLIAGNWIGLDVDGIARGMTFEGIRVTYPGVGQARNNTIGGLAPADRNIISGNGTGIFFFPENAALNQVIGNFIGTDPSGTLPRGNKFAGVQTQAATNITIGGASPGAANVISACFGAGSGVSLLGSANVLIQGNRIGTDVSGQYDLGNIVDGIAVMGCSNVRIVGNQIANNHANGVRLTATTLSRIEGNFIGTDAAGVRPLGNAEAGIAINGETNRVGGLISGAANVIQYNGGPGVVVTSGSRNEISGNRIFDNGGLGIDLGLELGVTPNDPGDADTGQNYLQNYPVLTAASSSYNSTQVQGTLNSTPSSTFRLEFFASPAWDSTSLAEGQLWLGDSAVTTDANGNASFTALLPVGTPTNYLVTATATDADGNTSEFSAGVAASVGTQNVSVSITTDGFTPTISWPGTAILYRLETTDSLGPTSQWRPVTSGVVNVGEWSVFSVTNVFEKASQFFRLKKL